MCDDDQPEFEEFEEPLELEEFEEPTEEEEAEKTFLKNQMEFLMIDMGMTPEKMVNYIGAKKRSKNKPFEESTLPPIPSNIPKLQAKVLEYYIKGKTAKEISELLSKHDGIKRKPNSINDDITWLHKNFPNVAPYKREDMIKKNKKLSERK